MFPGEQYCYATVFLERREKNIKATIHLYSIQVCQEHILDISLKKKNNFLLILVFAENLTPPSLQLSALCPLSHPETSANPPGGIVQQLESGTAVTLC